MIIVCAWHKQEQGRELVIGIKEPLNDSSLSHGICAECTFAIKSKLELEHKKREMDKSFEAFMRLCK